MKKDLDDWLFQYAEQFYRATNDRIRRKLPNLLYSTQNSIGGWGGCVRKPIALAAAAHNDMIMVSQVPQPVLDLFASWGIDRPLLSWEAFAANADSYYSQYPHPDGYDTQASRGAAMANKIQWLQQGIGKGSSTYPIAGVKFWAHSDRPDSEKSNWGLISPNDKCLRWL